MDFTVISVGKLKEEYYISAADEYIKRIGAFAGLNMIDIPLAASRPNPNASETQEALSKEGRAILSRIPSGAYVVSLCVEGVRLTSDEFSKKIEKVYLSPKKGIYFVIGSSYGLGENVKSASDMRLSLSEMTFPHRLSKIMLLEQLYRALTIQNNKKYHK